MRPAIIPSERAMLPASESLCRLQMKFAVSVAEIATARIVPVLEMHFTHLSVLDRYSIDMVSFFLKRIPGVNHEGKISAPERFSVSARIVLSGIKHIVVGEGRSKENRIANEEIKAHSKLKTKECCTRSRS